MSDFISEDSFLALKSFWSATRILILSSPSHNTQFSCVKPWESYYSFNKFYAQPLTSNLYFPYKWRKSYHWKYCSPWYIVEISISFGNVTLSCSKMWAHEAYRGRIKQQTDCYSTLVSSLPFQSCLYGWYCHISKYNNRFK